MEVSEPVAERISIKGKNLRTKLRVISSLLFIQPFLVVSYILYKEGLFSNSSYLFLFFLALLVVLGGMVILRETFDKFIMVAGVMKRAEAGEAVTMEIQKDTVELREISLSFNKIVEKLHEASRKLDEQTGELLRALAERDRVQNELNKLNEELETKVEARTKQLVETQDELVRTEKLAVIAKLAGTVGHELRNPLGVISNALYYLKMIMPNADEKVAEYLAMIGNEVAYSESALSDLLEFSRIKAPHKTDVPVSELINSSLLKCSVPENIVVETDIPQDLSAAVDPSQIIQIFRNLTMNSIQAMSRGGSLRIAAHKVSGDSPQFHGLTSPVESPGPRQRVSFIEVSVSDTGEGILSKNIEKLFQPLFSTRARGIGVGLTVSKKLAEANGGRLCLLDTAIGKGSTFTVTLPMAGRS